MPIYWTIYIWVFLFTVRYQNSYGSLTENRRSISKSAAFWMVSLPLFFIALRSNCIDTAGYISHFLRDANDFESFLSISNDSFLFWGLTYYIKTITSNNFQLWIALIAILQMVLMTKTLRKYSENYALSIYIFFASCMFANWMCNGMRQFVAVCIIFACSKWLTEKKYIPYLIVLVILMGFGPIWKVLGRETGLWYFGGVHQSIVILIPIIFCATGKAFNKRTLFAALVMSIVMMSGLLDDIIETTASNTVYEEDLEYMAKTGGASIFRALVAFVPVVMALLCWNKVNKKSVPPIINLSVNMSVFSAFIYIASTMTSGMYVGRLPIYCEMYNLILIPWLLNNPYRKNKTFISTVLVLAYFVFFCYQMYVGFDKLEYGSSVLGINYW